MMSHFPGALVENWHVWLVTVVLVVAATIDGYKLKVPNWITFPMILSGWIYSMVVGGGGGFVESLIGTAVGLGLLLPAYAIGGMGAGDVKLLMGVGAWMGAKDTFWAFVVSTIVGGVIAVLMVAYHRQWKHHISQFWGILTEIFVIRNPSQLSAIAAERKPTMRLLPYGIPIAIGSIAYFAWWRMLL